MGFVLRLDVIQGGDPMIWEGKRAVSRELTQILEFVDKVLAGRHTIILMQPSKNRAMRTSMDFDSVNHALDGKHRQAGENNWGNMSKQVICVPC
ncbi:hypothetical protein U9M48_004194 [Paspalum notatum var. saurae]|uniref:Uncharacterized protein n=1 Tax=Paspalum notatum var. saurae TaxID=547442 RepID=A0AAQ3SHI7_PASNO